MRLPMKAAAGVRDGSVTLAFRRWQRQDVQPGATFTSSSGMILVGAVTVVDPVAITDAEAVAAGHVDADRLRARLAPDESLATYRVEVSWAGEDPRLALRQQPLTDADVAALDMKLQRLDKASSFGPWTLATLQKIAERPEVRAPDLAAEFGRETAPFKLDVRKLKALGLTISHRVGYELAPRGRDYLDRTTRRGRTHVPPVQPATPCPPRVGDERE